MPFDAKISSLHIKDIMTSKKKRKENNKSMSRGSVKRKKKNTFKRGRWQVTMLTVSKESLIFSAFRIN
jgi:hypothetical protein